MQLWDVSIISEGSSALTSSRKQCCKGQFMFRRYTAGVDNQQASDQIEDGWHLASREVYESAQMTDTECLEKPKLNII